MGLIEFDHAQPGGGTKRRYRIVASGEEMGIDPSGRWSPDDKYIAVVCGGKDHPERRRQYGIVRVSDGRSIFVTPKVEKYRHDAGINLWHYDWLPLKKNVDAARRLGKGRKP